MEYSKDGQVIEISFLSEEEICSKEYVDFVNTKDFINFINGANESVSNKMSIYDIRKARMDNYSSYYEFKVLGVRVDGKLVGQSCAYKTYAIVHGEKKEFWWGLDAFLLPGYRGLGLGMKLQKKLHEDFPNFSSAWYTPINGFIKKKCGANEIANICFGYYPVSTGLSVFMDLVFLKIFKRHLPFRISIPYFYSFINSIFTDSKLKKYNISEIPNSALGSKEAEFMEDALKTKDFHIERSEYFLKWRYKTLSGGYHMLKFEQDGKTEAIVSFSNCHKTAFVVSSIYGVTIYDLIISPGSKLTNKRILLYVANWLRKRKDKIDGFQTLERFNYIGKIVYPYPSVSLLSTLDGHFTNIYLTFADQDMDQL